MTNAGNRLALDGREEASEPMSLLAGLGGDHLIADQQDRVRSSAQMRADEKPADLVPGNLGVEYTLDGSVAAALFRPAGQAQHGDPASHAQHCRHHDAQAVQGSGIQAGG